MNRKRLLRIKDFINPKDRQKQKAHFLPFVNLYTVWRKSYKDLLCKPLTTLQIQKQFTCSFQRFTLTKAFFYLSSLCSFRQRGRASPLFESEPLEKRFGVPFYDSMLLLAYNSDHHEQIDPSPDSPKASRRLWRKVKCTHARSATERYPITLHARTCNSPDYKCKASLCKKICDALSSYKSSICNPSPDYKSKICTTKEVMRKTSIKSIHHRIRQRRRVRMHVVQQRGTPLLCSFRPYLSSCKAKLFSPMEVMRITSLPLHVRAWQHLHTNRRFVRAKGESARRALNRRFVPHHEQIDPSPDSPKASRRLWRKVKCTHARSATERYPTYLSSCVPLHARTCNSYLSSCKAKLCTCKKVTSITNRRFVMLLSPVQIFDLYGGDTLSPEVMRKTSKASAELFSPKEVWGTNLRFNARLALSPFARTNLRFVWRCCHARTCKGKDVMRITSIGEKSFALQEERYGRKEPSVGYLSVALRACVHFTFRKRRRDAFGESGDGSICSCGVPLYDLMLSPFGCATPFAEGDVMRITSPSAKGELHVMPYGQSACKVWGTNLRFNALPLRLRVAHRLWRKEQSVDIRCVRMHLPLHVRGTNRREVRHHVQQRGTGVARTLRAFARHTLSSCASPPSPDYKCKASLCTCNPVKEVMRKSSATDLYGRITRLQVQSEALQEERWCAFVTSGEGGDAQDEHQIYDLYHVRARASRCASPFAEGDVCAISRVTPVSRYRCAQSLQFVRRQLRKKIKQGFKERFVYDHVTREAKQRFSFAKASVFWYSKPKIIYTIVRPLLHFLRCNITMACIWSSLPVYPDLSNLKMQYSRNRIRKQIVPTIKVFLNPKMEKALFGFSESYNLNKKKRNEFK